MRWCKTLCIFDGKYNIHAKILIQDTFILPLDLFALSLFSKFMRGMWISLFTWSPTCIMQVVCFFVFRSKIDRYGFEFCSSTNKRQSNSAQTLLSIVLCPRSSKIVALLLFKSILGWLLSTNVKKSSQPYNYPG